MNVLMSRKFIYHYPLALLKMQLSTTSLLYSLQKHYYNSPYGIECAHYSPYK
jgi:hypothetical protein